MSIHILQDYYFREIGNIVNINLKETQKLKLLNTILHDSGKAYVSPGRDGVCSFLHILITSFAHLLWLTPYVNFLEFRGNLNCSYYSHSSVEKLFTLSTASDEDDTSGGSSIGWNRLMPRLLQGLELKYKATYGVLISRPPSKVPRCQVAFCPLDYKIDSTPSPVYQFLNRPLNTSCPNPFACYTISMAICRLPLSLCAKFKCS